jgi:hypothetical protein
MRRGFFFSALVLLLSSPSQGFFNFKMFWPFGEEQAAPKPRAERPKGQKVKTFKLERAHSEDLLLSLQNYLKLIKSQGDIISNPEANTLIVTDSNENLSRMAILVREMDQVYSNPKPFARKMLANQNMMRAMRTLALQAPGAVTAELASGVRGTEGFAAPPTAGAVAMAGPAVSAVPGSIGAPIQATGKDLEEMHAGPRRIMDDQPLLQAYKVIGWLQDGRGYLVVLRNQGQRYIYRGGKIHFGSVSNEDFVDGVSGIVRGSRLILSDNKQTVVSLPMTREEESLGQPR